MDTANTGGGSEALRMVRDFAAPVERVFEAWSEPELLKGWAWGSLGQRPNADVDLRVGGAYCVTTARPDGDEWSFSGTYLEIVPNRKLVYTVHWSAPMGYEAPDETVTVEFQEQGGTTRVTFLHEGVPSAEARSTHEEGWANTFDALEHILSTP